MVSGHYNNVLELLIRSPQGYEVHPRGGAPPAVMAVMAGPATTAAAGWHASMMDAPPPAPWAGRIAFIVVLEGGQQPVDVLAPGVGCCSGSGTSGSAGGSAGGGGGGSGTPLPSGARYTRDALRALLLLLGVKPRLAHKAMTALFNSLEAALSSGRAGRAALRAPLGLHPHRNGRVAVSLARPAFLGLVCEAAAGCSYKIGPASDELKVACSLRERRRCVVVLLCGTSGSGKSTLASLLVRLLRSLAVSLRC